MNWYLTVLKRYAVFTGRACRSEYWLFVLINVIVAIVLGVIEGMLGSPGIVSGLYSLAVLVPSLAVTVRRLHDTGRSGWWILIGLVPIIGGLVLLIFVVLPGTAGPNPFGEGPDGAL